MRSIARLTARLSALRRWATAVCRVPSVNPTVGLTTAGGCSSSAALATGAHSVSRTATAGAPTWSRSDAADLVPRRGLLGIEASARGLGSLDLAILENKPQARVLRAMFMPTFTLCVQGKFRMSTLERWGGAGQAPACGACCGDPGTAGTGWGMVGWVGSAAQGRSPPSGNVLGPGGCV